MRRANPKRFFRPKGELPKSSKPKGRNRVWLPNFTITLLNTPHLPATWASFLVPLNFNKLDLKDYLYNAYNISIMNVRSFIKYQKVELAASHRPRKWFRKRGIKKMTVEMADERAGGPGPFVWPAAVEDFADWSKEEFEAANDEQEARAKETYQPMTVRKTDGKKIAEQAKALLQGKEKWQPSWMKYNVAQGR